jgi:deazaflavin-dependent oxidoreductase (nitroreductase family)
MVPGSAEARFFRALNRVVEPTVRRGFGSPALAPSSIIVLETIGRNSGEPRKTPLASVRVGRHILVATFRGRRSGWVKNLAAEPNVRYWIGGKIRRAKATVIPPGTLPTTTRGFPPTAKRLMPYLAPYARAGWAFAFLTPTTARTTRSKAGGKQGRPPRRSRGGRGVRTVKREP